MDQPRPFAPGQVHGDTLVATPSAVSTIWTLTTAFGIFLFQLSTVLVVRAKTGGAGNFPLKQVINLAVGIISWYLLGYAFSYGTSLDRKLKNKFIGNYAYAMARIREGNHNTTSYGYAWFIQSFMYAMVCNSIVASVLGGRSSTAAHVLSTTYVVSFLYPVIAHFIWSTDGWLSAYKPQEEVPVGTIGAIDVAGSGVVHLLGASISLAASIFLKKKDAPKAASEDSLALTLAYFIKLFAIYSFVTGSTISIDLDNTPWANHGREMNPAPGKMAGRGFADASNRIYQAVGRAAVCTTLSVAASGLTVLFLESLLSKEVNLTQATNALLVGFAAISSNVITCEPWAAIIAGFIGALFYVGGRRAFKGLKDGDAFAVHGLGGIWGLLFTGVLCKPKYIRDAIGSYMYPKRYTEDSYNNNNDNIVPASTHAGVFYPSEGPNGKLLACMILEIVIVFLWGFIMALPLFGLLSAMKKLTEKTGDKYAEKTDA